MKQIYSPNLTGDDVQVVLHMPQRFARGGLASAAQRVAKAGRYGDDMIVHMNKHEFQMLREAWGEPTYHPKTGMPEYFDFGSLLSGVGDAFGGWGSVASAALPILGSLLSKNATTNQSNANAPYQMDPAFYQRLGTNSITRSLAPWAAKMTPAQWATAATHANPAMLNTTINHTPGAYLSQVKAPTMSGSQVALSSLLGGLAKAGLQKYLGGQSPGSSGYGTGSDGTFNSDPLNTGYGGPSSGDPMGLYGTAAGAAPATALGVPSSVYDAGLASRLGSATVEDVAGSDTWGGASGAADSLASGTGGAGVATGGGLPPGLGAYLAAQDAATPAAAAGSGSLLPGSIAGADMADTAAYAPAMMDATSGAGAGAGAGVGAGLGSAGAAAGIAIPAYLGLSTAPYRLSADWWKNFNNELTQGTSPNATYNSETSPQQQEYNAKKALYSMLANQGGDTATIGGASGNQIPAAFRTLAMQYGMLNPDGTLNKSWSGGADPFAQVAAQQAQMGVKGGPGRIYGRGGLARGFAAGGMASAQLPPSAFSMPNPTQMAQGNIPPPQNTPLWGQQAIQAQQTGMPPPGAPGMANFPQQSPGMSQIGPQGNIGSALMGRPPPGPGMFGAPGPGMSPPPMSGPGGPGPGAPGMGAPPGALGMARPPMSPGAGGMPPGGLGRPMPQGPVGMGAPPRIPPPAAPGRPFMGRMGMFDRRSVGGQIRGPGTGTSDSIPARLSDGEYVIPAHVVAALGDGSTEAGAKKLDEFQAHIRRSAGRQMAVGRHPTPTGSPLAILAKLGALK